MARNCWAKAVALAELALGGEEEELGVGGDELELLIVVLVLMEVPMPGLELAEEVLLVLDPEDVCPEG